MPDAGFKSEIFFFFDKPTSDDSIGKGQRMVGKKRRSEMNGKIFYEMILYYDDIRGGLEN